MSFLGKKNLRERKKTRCPLKVFQDESESERPIDNMIILKLAYQMPGFHLRIREQSFFHDLNVEDLALSC